MNDPLRVYEPHECDAQGVPLDWEYCRACMGAGENRLYRTPCPMSICHNGWCGYSRDEMCQTCQGHGEVWVTDQCGTCDGHGSLKAAALAYFRQTACAACGSETLRDVCAEADHVVFGCRPGGHDLQYRCQGCGHPMSDGEWVGEFGDEILRDDLLRKPHNDLHQWAERSNLVHYSSCDDGCRHDGHGRQRVGKYNDWQVMDLARLDSVIRAERCLDGRVEASWRQVDVRTLGWPHDLRTDHLAVLCLRCWAGRVATSVEEIDELA